MEATESEASALDEQTREETNSTETTGQAEGVKIIEGNTHIPWASFQSLREYVGNSPRRDIF